MTFYPFLTQLQQLAGGTIPGSLTLTGSLTAASAVLTAPLPVTSGGTGVGVTGGQLPWLPVDSTLLATNIGDDWTANSTGLMIAGTVYLLRISVRAAITATNIVFAITTAGLGASTGSFAGLYNSAGTLLSGSSDNGASLTSTGTISTALTTPQALSAGSFYWVALLVNLATTQPTLARSGAATANFNLGAAAFRQAVNGTAQTTLPASITPASNTGAGAFGFLVGIT